MIILYHANCNDGSASALAAWLKLGDDGHQYIPVKHRNPAPSAVVGEDVVMVDFCYPRDELINMKAKSILILDHHISAQKDLATPFDPKLNITAHFDMSKSGAVLSWEHFFPNQPLPRLFTLIQDRDIWLNQYPESSYLNYGLNIFSTDFRQWQQLIHDENQLDKTIDSGHAIYQFVQLQIKNIIKSRTYTKIAGFDVPIVNAPSFMMSDLIHQLLEVEPKAPFAAAYSDDLVHGIRYFSLRSEDSREDVSVIAKKLGGGGHRNAAAFNQDLDSIVEV